VKIRLFGTEEECRDAATLIRETFNVVYESEPRPGRGNTSLVFVYIDTRPGPPVAR